MNGYRIRVIIEDGYQVVAEAVAPMGSELREVIQPLKVSDAALSFLDTPNAVVRWVKADREAYAAELTPKIAKVLLDAMAARDLFNGYTKAEQAQFKKAPHDPI